MREFCYKCIFSDPNRGNQKSQGPGICSFTSLSLILMLSQFETYCPRRCSSDPLFLNLHVSTVSRQKVKTRQPSLCSTSSTELESPAHDHSDEEAPRQHWKQLSGAWAFIICSKWISKITLGGSQNWDGYPSFPDEKAGLREVNDLSLLQNSVTGLRPDRPPFPDSWIGVVAAPGDRPAPLRCVRTHVCQHPSARICTLGRNGNVTGIICLNLDSKIKNNSIKCNSQILTGPISMYYC